MANLELLPGTLTMLILRVLERGALHGYAIAREIGALSDEALGVEQGSLYPALFRCEKSGWVRSRWGKSETGRRVRVYSLTPRGERHLRAELDRWERMVAAVGGVVRGPA